MEINVIYKYNISITLELEKSFTKLPKSAVQNSCFKVLIYIRLNSGKRKWKPYLTCFTMLHNFFTASQCH